MRRSITICCALLLTIPPLAWAEKALSSYQIETLVEELRHPWSLAFLPGEKMLISERGGKLLLVEDGRVSTVTGLPGDILVKGQGGLQDVVVHPEFSENAWLYLSYASGTLDKNALKVIRAKLVAGKLSQVETLFTASPLKDTPVHYGAKMVFMPDNTLLITSGDGFDYREDAQRLNNQLGKILRINDDGSIPADNPFYSEKDSPLAQAVFSYGHRNPQGLVYHEAMNSIFAHEHGPAGGDEINLIKEGNNYGWPVITNGRDYSGASISPFKTYPGMELPMWDWTPSIAPSGLAVYEGKQFPQMQGDLLVGALKDRDVKWMQIEQGKIVNQVSLFAELDARIRDVRVKDGEIYLLTDSNDGKLLKITK